jgi:hypothetical protein
VTAIDPAYAAKAAQIVAARQAEEAARVARRVVQWGRGLDIDVVIARPEFNPPLWSYRLTAAEQERVEGWYSDGKITISPRPIADHRLHLTLHVEHPHSVLSDAWARHLCAVDSNLLAQLRAAEAAL